jgi:glycosyltransferase involved in cell wall biosynthesis
MLRLAEGFASRGFDVDLVLVRAEGPYLAEVSSAVRVLDLAAPRVLASLPALVRYLRRERPDALVSALNHANLVAIWASRLARFPGRVAVNEQIQLSGSRRHSVLWRQRRVPSFAKRFYPWADYVIGNSQGVADDLHQLIGISRDRIPVIFNPVVAPDLEKKVEEPLSHPWLQPGQPPVVLAVGRLKAHKGFSLLISAFAEVRRLRPARLLILGEGPERAALESLVARLGLADDVALPGFVENPYAYMARAAAFVLSSQWEGLPTVMIEALYCGAPVVATDCPSGPREILRDGKFGQLIPIGDAAAMARALEEALAGRAPRPSEESWRLYDLDTVVDQYDELLFGRSSQPW